VSRDNFAKHFGIAEIYGFAYGAKKVYTLLILVCTAQYLVYSWFAHLEKHASNAVSLSMNKLGLNLLVISGALKYGMPQNFSS
jgi:hypothetical protein